MRIALLTDTYRWGGAERILQSTAQAALTAGHEVIVLAPQQWLLDRLATDEPAPARRLISGRPIASLPGFPGRALLQAGRLLSLQRCLRRVEPDLLHVSNGGYPGSVLCCLALPVARRSGVPYTALSVHAAPRPRILGPLESVLDAAVWRDADVVAGATGFVGVKLSELRGMPPDAYAEVPYGVPEPRGADARTAMRKRLQVRDDELLVGMISAGSEAGKGHGVLIDALAGTPATVRAVIAGAPLPVAASDRIATLGLGSRVTVTGHLEDIDPLYYAIDVLAVPSVADEGLPLVILEAMAAGRAVLASHISGIPEAVVDGETGRLLEPGNSGELAAAMTTATMQRERLRTWGEAAKARWALRFSPSAMAAATLALYERAASVRAATGK